MRVGAVGRDEVVDLAIGVAGNILYGSRAVGTFVEPADGHDGEQLVDRPRVGQRLEEREVAEVFVGQQLRNLAQLFGGMLHVRGDFAYLAGYRPEELFDLGPGAQVEQSQAEEVECLLANLQGIVPRLEQARLVHVVPDFIEFIYQFVRVFAQFLLLVPDGERGSLEHLEYQHRVVCGERAARLGDDVGLRQVVLDTGIDQRRNRVVHILLYRVVHAALARR